jgi:hypothetical protein
VIWTKGRRALLAGPSACLALVLLAGCAIGRDDSSDFSDTPRRDLAGRPVASGAATTGPAPTTGPSASGAAGTTGQPISGVPQSSATGSTAARPGTSNGGSAQPTSYRTVATLTDAQHDSGIGAPDKSDLRSVVIEDGGGQARVTVRVGGPLPPRAADGEAFGIGVDFYRAAGQQESDYQLFADGGPDGWFAYLHTPKGFARYPGTFALLGDGLSFTVPWNSLGSLQSGQFSSFVDWTQRHSTGNDAANDRAPLVGTSPFAR